jgi:hypothetical protein
MWNWSWWRVVPLFGLFLLVDTAFLVGMRDQDCERWLGAALAWRD